MRRIRLLWQDWHLCVSLSLSVETTVSGPGGTSRWVIMVRLHCCCEHWGKCSLLPPYLHSDHSNVFLEPIHSFAHCDCSSATVINPSMVLIFLVSCYPVYLLERKCPSGARAVPL